MIRLERIQHSAKLRFETLEERRLLTVAAFQSELLTDVDGIPGELIADNTLIAGQKFFLRITAQEFAPRSFGLQVASVDLDWDASLLDVIAEDYSPATAITSQLPFFQTGELDQSNGTITRLSGTSMLSSPAGRPIGSARAETFAIIPMRAGNTPGTAILELTESQSPTIILPNIELNSKAIRFDQESITILPSASHAGDDSLEMDTAVVSSDPHETNPETLDASDGPVDADQTTSNAEPTLTSNSAVAEVFSFDANGDRVFDLADLGWINVMASADAAASSPVMEVVEVASAANVELAKSSKKESAVLEHVDSPVSTTREHTCFAFPELGSIAAAERWLDALAKAWIADEELRARRRASRVN